MTKTTMMVATKDFTAVVDGVRQEIVAGADRAVPDHELVRLRPECWAPESAPAVRASGSVKAQASPKPGASAVAPKAHAGEPWRLGPPPARHDVELRAIAPAASTVRLAHRAYWSIRDLARASEDGRETGGLLLGRRAYAWQPLNILEATGPGGAQRAVGSLHLDHAHDIASEESCNIPRSRRGAGAPAMRDRGWQKSPYCAGFSARTPLFASLSGGSGLTALIGVSRLAVVSRVASCSCRTR